MPKLFCVVLASCAYSAWQPAAEGCASLRAATNACMDAAREIELRLDSEWRSTAVSFPPYGHVHFAADLDAAGHATAVHVIENTSTLELERNARELLTAKTYPLSAQRRIYVRFNLQPAEVVALMPPQGSDAQLERLLAAKQPAFRECYRTITTDNGDFNYKGALLFTITETGGVSDARLSPMPDKDFAACVVDELKEIAFPKWEYAGRAVKWPLQLEIRIKKRGRS